MADQVSMNPLESALNPKQKQAPLYGRLELEAFHVILEKGRGRVPFDPAVHPANRRRTAINIGIYPLPETNLNFTVNRQYLAEAHQEGWAVVTLPSLRELGVADLSALGRSFVKAELVHIGFYTDRDGNERRLTAPRILALYDNHAQCLEAYRQETGAVPMEREPDTLRTPGAASPPAAGAPAPQAGQPQRDMRAVAVKLLPELVKPCMQMDGQVNARELAARIEQAPIVRDYFNIASDEVLEAIAEVQNDVRAEAA